MKPGDKVLSLEANRAWAKRIYQKLLIVVPDLWEISEYAKSRVDGYMDLNLDVLIAAKGYRRIALSHYWKHDSGDMIADPDMEIGVYRDWEMAEALTYQDMWSYDDVYSGPDGQADRRHYLHCNAFLEKWLEALAEQGHLLRK
ncbi:DUF1249 domain-containing protein [Dechloromonas sp. ARDL1]|uniref:DUF1249 domain-containing protein n=1 Tax=Dechloromonas sp. ARDL1 TaxID=3322121 RepID=UPI003DA75889